MTKDSKTGRSILAMAAMAALAVCSGCATIKTSKPNSLDGITFKGADAAPLEHVWLSVSGEYMFSSLPLASGQFFWNEETNQLDTRTVFFEDLVGLSELQEALLKYADSKNCDLVDVTYYDADTSYADVSCYEGLVGFLFGNSTMGVSAVLVPRKVANKM